MTSDYTIVISHYRIKEGTLGSFLDLLGRHWPVLRELELATDTLPRYFVDDHETGQPPLVIEVFEWASDTAAQRAHTHPDVSTMWEKMGEFFAEEGPKPAREHFSVRPVDVN
jgi:hypothetical protein